MAGCGLQWQSGGGESGGFELSILPSLAAAQEHALPACLALQEKATNPWKKPMNSHRECRAVLDPVLGSRSEAKQHVVVVVTPCTFRRGGRRHCAGCECRHVLGRVLSNWIHHRMSSP